ncbi:MAG: glutathione S-transferase C-terminal domain-containing protein [Caulobacterales bacterium]
MPSEPLALLGAPGSPYTRKMIAYLRFRRLSYVIIWGGHQSPPPNLPAPKVKLLPTFYFATADGGVEAVVDSTPITRRLEAENPGRAALPRDPVVSFLNDLIEDYADEWLTKAMFHYRWHHEADRINAGPLLVYWSVPQAGAADGEAAARAFTQRQFDRLYVVGSNDVTAETIEASYVRFLSVLDALIERNGYVLGGRPASADFAIYGQLTQLGIIEPTSAAIMARHPRVRAWLDRVEDLSGLEIAGDDGWISREAAANLCRPLLTEIGRVYTPFLIANAQAHAQGAATFETKIDGRVWTQPTFPYQAKCLQRLRAGHAALAEADRAAIDAVLAGTGCERLFDRLEGRTDA